MTSKTRGDAAIIDLMNQALTKELTAVNQYVLHAKIAENWGYNRLYKKIWHESIDEMKHATTLIERVLYLGGLPNLQRLGRLRIGETVHEMLKCDLALEEEAIPALNEGIEACRAAGDNGSRLILEDILASEEEHIDWLESQLDQIDQMGIENYLAEQIKGGE